MADEEGDTKKLLAQKEAENEKLKADLEKAEKRVENAQGLIHEWEERGGENRKAAADGAQEALKLARELQEATAAVRKAEDDLAAARAELAELKSKGPTGGDRDTRAEEKTADEIEAELSDAEAEQMAIAWGNLTDEQRKVYKKDDAERRKLLLAAKAAAREAAESDLSDWRRTPAQGKPSEVDEGELRKLFVKQKRRAAFVPSAPRGGAPREGAHQRREPEAKKATWLT